MSEPLQKLLSAHGRGIERNGESTPATSIIEPVGRWVPTAIEAKSMDGTPYAGNLLADILAYRELRGRALCLEPLSEQEKDAFTVLERKLRQPPETDAGSVARLRFYYRYQCGFSAELRTEGPDQPGIAAMVEDVSAGGVKLQSQCTSDPGDQVWLVLDNVEPATTRKIVLPSRVAWRSARGAGLMFAGAPICLDTLRPPDRLRPPGK